MSVLAVIGEATLKVIGLGPQEIIREAEANWPSQQVFDADTFYQPTGDGEVTMTLRLATRPHTHGGLEQYAALERHRKNRDVVMFMRLSAASSGLPVGEVLGNVFVRSLSSREEKIAPDGIGWRYEVEVELVFCGEMMTGD